MAVLRLWNWVGPIGTRTASYPAQVGWFLYIFFVGAALAAALSQHESNGGDTQFAVQAFKAIILLE